jgi:hypothetical protein
MCTGIFVGSIFWGGGGEVVTGLFTARSILVTRLVTVTSSSYEISMDDNGGIEEGRRYSARPSLFYKKASRQIFKDDVNSFSSTSDMCFMVTTHISCILK